MPNRWVPWRRSCIFAFIVGISMVLFPFLTSKFTLYLFTILAVTMIAVIGLHILTGLAGQISVGQAAFMAIGGYTSTYFLSLGLPYYLSILAAAVMAGLAGLLIGVPALRIRGLYLAVSTLALHFIVWHISLKAGAITGGGHGRPVPQVFSSDIEAFYVVVAILGAALYITLNLQKSKLGRAFMAIREQELVASASGVDVTMYKLIAFLLSSMLVGVAGSLYATYVGRVAPDQFTLTLTIQHIGMVLVGGLGSLGGSLVGVAFFTFLPYGLESAIGAFFASSSISSRLFELTNIIFGAIVIGFLIFEPKGFAGLLEMLKEKILFLLKRPSNRLSNIR